MENKITKKITADKIALTSLGLGLASILLWEFSIIPILAIVFGIIGITRTIKNKTGRIGFATTGIIMGIIFLIVRISHGN